MPFARHYCTKDAQTEHLFRQSRELIRKIEDEFLINELPMQYLILGWGLGSLGHLRKRKSFKEK